MINSIPVGERPLEKAMEHGLKSLSNQELLAIILNSGSVGKSVIQLSGEILSLCNENLRQIYTMQPEEFLEIKGMGKTKAYRLCACFELNRRIRVFNDRKTYLNCSEDVAMLMMEKLRYEKKEHFYSIVLDSKNAVIATDLVSIGSLSCTLIHPREVFIGAIKKCGKSVVLVHNHPSGNPEPSSDDFQTTIRLVECGRLLGIDVLDHVVIGDGKFISIFKDCSEALESETGYVLDI